MIKFIIMSLLLVSCVDRTKDNQLEIIKLGWEIEDLKLNLGCLKEGLKREKELNELIKKYNNFKEYSMNQAEVNKSWSYYKDENVCAAIWIINPQSKHGIEPISIDQFSDIVDKMELQYLRKNKCRECK